ncbi:MAG TPA: hypothetical protein P5318_06445 [Candidatus Hydrogenedentes bacterium]|nr:hypothetical protein [Candidatus Hydrogenedentota bacterium]HOV72994.1 hypothetical protein [Candidatus Hydrogenedentota bacterium]HPC15840.1 hypothetical protein [Candidatus Hydrogenedentota bacterium]HRT19751.1 hypothetical protein [Candidatus Hydrogenedentota bacterium]HRT64525.1 hypothetical protein [Candidatus Hydrogenedentota bacterium]
MAIRGSSYTKTTWTFQERPVSSSKLNLWDDRIEAALELAFWLLNLAWGGGDGVLRGATPDDLKVEAKSPAGMTVTVKHGYAFISKMPFRLSAAMDTPVFLPPAVYPRMDLVQARLDTWGVSVKSGVEAASPSPPATDADCLALAQVYLRPGMTCIKNADDSVNGYLTDVRAFL